MGSELRAIKYQWSSYRWRSCHVTSSGSSRRRRSLSALQNDLAFLSSMRSPANEFPSVDPQGHRDFFGTLPMFQKNMFYAVKKKKKKNFFPKKKKKKKKKKK